MRRTSGQRCGGIGLVIFSLHLGQNPYRNSVPVWQFRRTTVPHFGQIAVRLLDVNICFTSAKACPPPICNDFIFLCPQSITFFLTCQVKRKSLRELSAGGDGVPVARRPRRPASGKRAGRGSSRDDLQSRGKRNRKRKALPVSGNSIHLGRPCKENKSSPFAPSAHRRRPLPRLCRFSARTAPCSDGGYFHLDRG